MVEARVHYEQIKRFDILKYDCEVLVIGGGGAGLRAALEAQEENPDSRVILVTKGTLGKSGVTATACSDRMAFHVTLPFTEPGGIDNWRYHTDDIYRIGGYVSDEDLAQLLAKNSREAFDYLDKLGVPWVKKNGNPDQFLTDGSVYARGCYTGPYTANHIERALVKKIKTTRVKILENVMIIDLITCEKKVIGAFGLGTRDNLILFRAKTTILATGGGGPFKDSVFPSHMTGDGYAMAYRAGAELVNMEFIQIGLCSVKTRLACSGSMMRALPKLVNDKEEDFLPKYFPKGTSLREIYLTFFQKGASWPVSSEHKSCLIDIAVFKERRENRKVFLDYRNNPQNLKWEELDQVAKWYKEKKGINLEEKEFRESALKRLAAINPEAVRWLKEQGIDLGNGDKIEIANAVQHFQGGVKIREKAQTTLNGLYAAGECAGGQHGANRPGGNSLLDCQVFGRIAGFHAARESRKLKDFGRIETPQIKKMRNIIKELKDERKGKKAFLVREEIQNVCSNFASIIRTEEGLSQGIKTLEELAKTGIHSDENGLIFAFETLNGLTVARMIMGSARLRKESRGPHLYFCSFMDAKFVDRDDNIWHKYIVIKKIGEEMKFEAREPLRLLERR